MREPVRERGLEGMSVLDHGKRRNSYRSTIEADHIDLGNEAPLSVDGENNSLVDRRRISVQWFSGTILTGLCGAALMGGAVFTSLDGETNFATVPERVQAALRGAFGDRTGAISHKSDRLPPPAELSSLRRVVRVSTTSRVGNREIVRVKPFIRVAANLSLTVSELSANIPPFNPLKMLVADAAEAPGANSNEDAPDGEIDAEVSFFTRDLDTVLPHAKIAATQPIDEVLARVRDAANWSGNGAHAVAVADARPTLKLAYAAEGNVDPYAGFEMRMAPENVTLMPKTATQATGGNPWNERTITLKKSESVADVLHNLGGTPEEVKAIIAALGSYGRPGAVKEGERLRVLLAPADDGQRTQPIRVVVVGDSGIEAVAALSDVGKYVAVDVHSIDTEVDQAKDEEEDDGKGVRLYQSIYETALRSQVPRPVIDDLIRVYSYDVDFQRRVQSGDSFEVLYSSDDENSDSEPDLLYAALTIGGETKKFYRFQSPDDGVVDYYDETGKSAKKFLVRKPVGKGLISSGFGSRRHPLLHYTRMHTGVDWAAPTGTPIYASGNGVIETMGWQGGYGRYIRIRHANGYETGYGHMSAFARNVHEGKKVRQGQVIGYVGSTGLSTGSHLHYEILINGRFVDPMKVRLPRGRVLEGALLARFDRERERLDNMLARAGSTRTAGTRARIASGR
jgi:murein DD-endopeptidase MepM/ murein hydrolase activator NlpD